MIVHTKHKWTIGTVKNFSNTKDLKHLVWPGQLKEDSKFSSTGAFKAPTKQLPPQLQMGTDPTPGYAREWQIKLLQPLQSPATLTATLEATVFLLALQYRSIPISIK